MKSINPDQVNEELRELDIAYQGLMEYMEEFGIILEWSKSDIATQYLDTLRSLSYYKLSYSDLSDENATKKYLDYLLNGFEVLSGTSDGNNILNSETRNKIISYFEKLSTSYDLINEKNPETIAELYLIIVANLTEIKQYPISESKTVNDFLSKLLVRYGEIVDAPCKAILHQAALKIKEKFEYTDK